MNGHPAGSRAPRKPDPPNTHGACGATWTGTRACHCSGCHHTFSGIGLFDKHRRGYGEHGQCINPADMPGVELRDGIWSLPEMTEAEKLARFGNRGAA